MKEKNLLSLRASSQSYCTREQVAKLIHGFKIPEAKQPFMALGHNFQEFVEGFIMQHLDEKYGRLLYVQREAEGAMRIEFEDGYVLMTGHVDGIMELPEAAGGYGLLEVKAIKDKSYRKLQRVKDWKDVYGHYERQAQAYMHMPELKGKSVFEGPFEYTFYVFINRDTGEMLGGLPIEHDAWTYREDMVLKRDQERGDEIRVRAQDVLDGYVTGSLPNDCDQIGHCFFCGPYKSNDVDNEGLADAFAKLRKKTDDGA
jgi:hypothetical protein